MEAQLKELHERMYERAQARLVEGTIRVDTYAEMKGNLEKVCTRMLMQSACMRGGRASDVGYACTCVRHAGIDAYLCGLGGSLYMHAFMHMHMHTYMHAFIHEDHITCCVHVHVCIYSSILPTQCVHAYMYA